MADTTFANTSPAYGSDPAEEAASPEATRCAFNDQHNKVSRWCATMLYAWTFFFLSRRMTFLQSRTGCKFLTGQGVQEGAAPLCRNDFSYRYCRL